MYYQNLYTLYTVHCEVHTVSCTLYPIHCTMCSVHCTFNVNIGLYTEYICIIKLFLYNVQCTAWYSVRGTVYMVQCTLYSVRILCVLYVVYYCMQYYM